MEALYSKIIERRAKAKEQANKKRQKSQINSFGLALLRKYSKQATPPPVVVPKIETPEPLPKKELSQEDIDFNE